MRIAEQMTQRSHPAPRKRQVAATIRFTSVSGSTNFQAKFISWSWRRRGSVPRIQMKTHIDIITFPKNQHHEGTQPRICKGADHPPRNSVVPRPEMDIMPTYSPRKKRANLKPEY